MKKLLALLLAVLMMFAAGCSEVEKAAYSALDEAVSEAASEAAEGTSEVSETAEDAGTYSQASEPENTGAAAQAAESGAQSSEQAQPAASGAMDEDGSYTTRDDVALYIHTYGKLPGNFITKAEARSLGWPGGSLEPYSPGSSIGGDRFGNYENLLPDAEGRVWYECDIDTAGADSRGAKRIVFSNDGLIYYTDDHYESFTQLYGG